ncbi:hypothetical protein Scep_020235 [Stephania cephalantha]|uniref:F-box associated domain-containing protein n=1 Tax=Stephania cephalantha TaxID=152367 RepID=A0AAP0ICA1_9MAGN
MRIALACNPHNPAFGFTIVGAGNDYYDQEYDWEGDNYQSPVPVRFVVYSSKTGEWRASKNDSEFLAPFGCHLWYPYVFTRGNKVCWCVGKHMLMFDIEEDNAWLIPLPNNHNDITPICFSSTNSCIDQLGDGELSYSRMANDGVVEIWLLREESNKFEWVNKYKVNLRMIIEENWNKSGYSQALGGRSCVQLLLYLDVEVAWFQVTSWDYCRKVFLFNLTTRELKWIDDEISPGPLFTFVPTLLPCPT